jgi:hypothetical protein
MLRQAQHDKAQRTRAVAISMDDECKRQAWPFEKVCKRQIKVPDVHECDATKAQ